LPFGGFCRQGHSGILTRVLGFFSYQIFLDDEASSSPVLKIDAAMERSNVFLPPFSLGESDNLTLAVWKRRVFN
jgi:hypothetical protein